ncbi:hypothetical protein F441_10794 [Phytophthora nicotianae CJ01A1]|uniref:Uncharacterized protein n=6 Tax=Phytophthora nicotianae TaxID=4792 RepID=W2Q631_PHYN3|nr:hypothetical protein PPTG_12530 [Phytophthora nicotianae INRA-310]ETI44430.1 hypothetical protein F443_10868 [Phytophthora nicotianae P1569]ETK84427.1 hypothetical protein L915_10604 [Phytophthora nicotianae]ETO73104.1 hypothetical protein F444_10929 [Phytophthora nicotianae P1976]ETP14253.1 hypothetical protein F441_10794 [Phytophthora nicotianae CJ01A1]ETP42311.1 hypothetical protein F442_10772 [Phytophthora nicotianae P10297]
MESIDHAVQRLHQIYTLQNVIRRRRHINLKSHQRLMEFSIELLNSEPLQGNPTLQRTAAIQKFSDAVAKFSWYVQNHYDKNRVVRVFNFTRMKKQRLIIADEVYDLFRMLNLAANVAVLGGQAGASVSAAMLPTRLDDAHSDFPTRS